jgi:hypothetical protein
MMEGWTISNGFIRSLRCLSKTSAAAKRSSIARDELPYFGLCLGRQELVDVRLVRHPGAEDLGWVDELNF